MDGHEAAVADGGRGIDEKGREVNAEICANAASKCLPEIFSLVLMVYEDRNYHACWSRNFIVQTKIIAEDWRYR